MSIGEPAQGEMLCFEIVTKPNNTRIVELLRTGVWFPFYFPSAVVRFSFCVDREGIFLAAPPLYRYTILPVCHGFGLSKNVRRSVSSEQHRQ